MIFGQSFGQHLWLWSAIIGLCAVTVVTRSFFLLTPSRFEFPSGVKRALRYAPTVAIVAVIAPDILMHQGRVDLTWHNPELLAGIVAVAVFAWRHSFILALLASMGVFTVLRLYG